jgi:UDP-N-acetylmuramyl pentapeptide phosphotransferase/UDP-N-acetylglucosamine-1-phosphate transferase
MDGAASVPFLAAWLAATSALASTLTWWAVRYAHRRRLLDLPGQRRSHRVPTPRGGGIAIVVAILACGLLPAMVSGSAGFPVPAWLLAAAVAAIALVGWLDDHSGLSARSRFLVHCIAAALVFAAPLLHALFAPQGQGAAASPGLAVVAAAIVTLGIVWSVNLHNFMDGIDGLLTMQALFVFCALAALLIGYGDVAQGRQLLVWAAACAGFLPFNFPRARIFMGDVGSGALGLLVAVALLWQVGTPGIAAASGLVLCSAFVTDATCTLLLRMLCGRRWYSAHREHLYQWLVRRGWSHARTVTLYMAWNLLIVLPVVYWMNRSPDARAGTGIGAAAALYAVAVVLWWSGKRACLRQACARRLHAAA